MSLIREGYAKVAVLGRDVVYVKLEELAGKAAPALISSALAWFRGLESTPGAALKCLVWTFASPEVKLPEGWAGFHQRVVEEELEEEMRRERKAYQAGLRRTVP